METLVKFFENSDKDNSNAVISRTLCKIAVVDRDWLKQNSNHPKAGEFWKIKIVRETCIGMTKGCLIVHPIERIDDTTLIHLVPGMYSESINNRVLILTPQRQENWIMPLSYKKYYLAQKNVYAIIVNLVGEKWPTP